MWKKRSVFGCDCFSDVLIWQEVFRKKNASCLFLFTSERMVTIMKRFYTAESVTEGHPDKLRDLIADSILDACLKEDENSRGACEVLESAGYNADGIHMDALIHKQSPDIAWAVERSRERRAGTVSVQSGLADASGSGEPHRKGCTGIGLP